MNWLAHLFLSEPNGAHRLGNLLGDLVKGKERQELNSCFQTGIKCHLLIDSFTDKHLIFRRSQQRISEKHRRYSPVLIDVFYDHFLAINWQKYSQDSLDTFTHEVYDSFYEYWDIIPVFPRMVIHRMMEQDWLGSSYYIYGVEASLKRIRAKLPFKHQDDFVVNSFLEQLEANYNELDQDFQEFFPEIIAYLDN